MKAKASKRKTAPKPAKKSAGATPKKAAKAKPKPKPPVAAKRGKPAPEPKRPAGKPAPPPKAAKPSKKASTAGSIAARRKRYHEHRERLLRKQAELMQAYSISKGDSQSHLDNGTEDYIDYAVNSYAREFLLSLTEMDRKQLLLVEEALRRIDRGEYGNCQQCGEEIAPKRLEVVPWVRHCVRCQELEEKGLLPQSTFALPGTEESVEDEEGADEDLRDEDVPEEPDQEEDEDSDEEDLPEVAGEIDDDSEPDVEEEPED
jgi:DnaK suppressor protein